MAIAYLSDKVMISADTETGLFAASDARNFAFNQRLRVCLVSNNDTVAHKYRVHDDPASNEATTTLWDGLIPIGETVDVSLNSERAVKGVSVYFEGGAPTNAKIIVRGLL